ncbi:unnamed protein product [marine sediment metagenome]|uniref:Uncharacterized protein n=1 Tax=marine sediment metagenome TaxID=412755 RepID=X1MCH6_9ZZZZ
MASEFPPATPKIRERTVDPSFVDLTDLLGSQLVAAGFRLYLNRFGQHIVFGGKDIKRTSVNAHTLKAIKHYCRLYLQKKGQNLKKEAK